jgi:uncharacterized protein
VVDPEVRKIVLQFVNALVTKGIRVEKAVLHGSYAHGQPREDSDVDLAIISPDLGRDRFEERKMLLQLAWRIDPRLEPIPVSSEAYEKDTWVPLIYEIREKGIEIQAA